MEEVSLTSENCRHLKIKKKFSLNFISLQHVYGLKEEVENQLSLISLLPIKKNLIKICGRNIDLYFQSLTFIQQRLVEAFYIIIEI